MVARRWRLLSYRAGVVRLVRIAVRQRTFPVGRLPQLLVNGSHVLVFGVKFLLENKVLLSILLLDGCQGVDIVFKFRSGHLFLLGVGEPAPKCFDEVVVGDPASVVEHKLPHGFLAELCGLCHCSSWVCHLHTVILSVFGHLGGVSCNGVIASFYITDCRL